MRLILIIIILSISTKLVAQNSGDKNPWSDTAFIQVNLKDTLKANKIVIVKIGQKAIIYLKEKQLRQDAHKKSNGLNSDYYSKIVQVLDSASLTSDSIFINQFLTNFDYIISEQLQKGNAKVFYNKQNIFVSTISHRLEKYGMYAYRFFYLPDNRPFFSTMEYSGIIENDKYFSDKSDLEKLYDKLSNINKE